MVECQCDDCSVGKGGRGGSKRRGSLIATDTDRHSPNRTRLELRRTTIPCEGQDKVYVFWSRDRIATRDQARWIYGMPKLLSRFRSLWGNCGTTRKF